MNRTKSRGYFVCMMPINSINPQMQEIETEFSQTSPTAIEIRDKDPAQRRTPGVQPDAGE